MAFTHCRNQEHYEILISDAIKKFLLQRPSFSAIIEQLSMQPLKPDQAILLTTPDAKRNRLRSRLAGKTIINAWIKTAQKLGAASINRLYASHLEERSVRFLAGRLLEESMHRYLYQQDAVFTLRKMTSKDGPKYKIFTARQIHGIPSEMDNNPIDGDIQLSLTMHRFSHKVLYGPLSASPTPADQIAPDTYFKPASPNPVFDSVLYFEQSPLAVGETASESSGAFVFQSSVTHDRTTRESPETLQQVMSFLQDCFPTTLSYVYVHSHDIQPTLHFSQTLVKLFGDRMYGMVISDVGKVLAQIKF